MIKRSLIKKICNTATFNRGEKLFLRNKVTSFQIEHDNPIDRIRAYILSSQSSFDGYQVKASYDTETDTLIDVHCDCPAFDTYYGSCKHCIALLLKYHTVCETRPFEEKISDEIISAALSEDLQKFLDLAREYKQEKSKKTTPAPYPQVRKPQTTPVIKALLEKQQELKTLPLSASDTYGKVRLVPYLNYQNREITIEFKIGINHLYVLKDVIAFAGCMEEHLYFSYGQKLGFIHAMEMFDKESQPLVTFLCQWVLANRQYHSVTNYYGYAIPGQYKAVRNIHCSSASLEEFLLSMNGSVYANINEDGEALRNIIVEIPQRTGMIKKEYDGFRVTLDPLIGFQLINYNVYFKEQTIYMVPLSTCRAIQPLLSALAASRNYSFYVQKEDAPAFCRDILPELRKFFTLESINFDESEYGLVPVKYEIYLDSPQNDFITCRAEAVYGEIKYNLFGDDSDQARRDLASEMAAASIIKSFFQAYDNSEHTMVISQEPDMIYELFVNGIPKLHELGDVFISDALKKYKVTDSPKVSVGVSLSGNLLELTMSAGELAPNDLVDILTRYNRKKKYFRLKNGDFLNIADDSFSALINLKDGLNLTNAQLKGSSIKLPKYTALYLDSELSQWQDISSIRNKDYKALIRSMKTIEDSDYEIPPQLSNILREYQKRGFLWIKTLKNNGFGGILADDMGLGKTLQVIAFLVSEQQEKGLKRALIICPASLVYNWNSELEHFAPELSVKMVIGSSKERNELITSASENDILITSYDLLKRDIEIYQTITFAYQFIDEAQYIKNHATQAAKAVKEVDAGFRLALTGTPVENRLSELWSIFDYLMPGYLYSYPKFREHLEQPIVADQDKKAADRLQRMIKPFVLRRLKKEVLTDLPDKLEENIYAQFEGEQLRLYDAHVQRIKLMMDKQSDDEFRQSKIQILAELTKLRQICCDPSLIFDNYKEASAKTDMCMELISNAAASGHKILLFSQFTTMLEKLTTRMQAEGISYYLLTGATPKSQRAEMVNHFNEDNTTVFCISLKAGGTGLNLTSADIVIHFDPWWNVAVQNQATDRAHRIGQTNVVTVYKLVMKNSIEENIIRLQEKKRELADQIINGEGMNDISFDKEEILELLKR